MLLFLEVHLNPNSIIEDCTDSPLHTFVPQPQMQPKMTSESEITRGAMKCSETLKQITTLSYNVGDVNALKELGSSLQSLHDKLLCYQKKKEKRMENITLKSTSLSQYNVKEMHLPAGWDNMHQ